VVYKASAKWVAEQAAERAAKRPKSQQDQTSRWKTWWQPSERLALLGRCYLMTHTAWSLRLLERTAMWSSSFASLRMWPPSLKSQRCCASSYSALGLDEAHIVRALRNRFGMTARNARVKLQRLQRDWRMSLQNHANTIERLAQTAFSNT